MEGYIYNANRVLEACLDPKTKKVPVELVEKCKGVVIMTMVQVGALITLQYGTGVMMKKKESGGWSAPSSVSVGGTSFGAVVGGQRLNFIIFIMDDANLEDFATKPQSRISLDASFAAGSMGAKGNVGQEAPQKGTVTFTLSEGVFAGLSLEMFTLESAAAQNEIFYDKENVKTKDILYKEDAVTIPDGSQVPDLQEKMEMLARGETWTPDDEAVTRSRHFARLAKEQSELFASGNLDVSNRSKKPQEAK
jgi:lipid-binding SYLF domain-containing protein